MFRSLGPKAVKNNGGKGCINMLTLLKTQTSKQQQTIKFLLTSLCSQTFKQFCIGVLN